MFWWSVNDHWSDNVCPVQIQHQCEAWPEHLLIGIIQFWGCSRHFSDTDWYMFASSGQMVQPVECCAWTKMDSTESIVLNTFDACCIIHLLCHTLSPTAFTTPITSLWAFLIVVWGCQVRAGIWGRHVLCWKHPQMVVWQVHSQLENHQLTASRLPFRCNLCS